MGGLTLSQIFITGTHCSLSSYNLWWSKEEKKRWGGGGGILGAEAPISLSLMTSSVFLKNWKLKLSAVNFTIYNQWNMLDSYFPKKNWSRRRRKHTWLVIKTWHGVEVSLMFKLSLSNEENEQYQWHCNSMAIWECVYSVQSW